MKKKSGSGSSREAGTSTQTRTAPPKRSAAAAPNAAKKKAAGGSKAKAETASKPAAKSGANTTAKTPTKPAAKPSNKVASKPGSKSAKASAKAATTTAGPKAPAKAPAKTVAGSSDAIAPKVPSAKAEAKSEAKSEGKAAAKSTSKVAAAAPAPAGDAASSGDGKPKRKGITIVSKKGDDKKPAKKTVKKVTVLPQPDQPLLGPGVKRPMPLIPSGPRAPRPESLDMEDSAKAKKSPFSKRELGRYRDILIRKRAELVGDVSMIESEALHASSAEAGRVAAKAGEEGSDDFERTLSLDLAAVDRRLIREIDDALARIEDNSYGLCELTGKPINPARLEELPWTRFSIEAARAIERGGLPA